MTLSVCSRGVVIGGNDVGGNERMSLSPNPVTVANKLLLLLLLRWLLDYILSQVAVVWSG